MTESTALAERTAAPIQELSFNTEQKQLIKAMFMDGKASDAEMAFFLTQAKRLGLDPINREIHFGRIQGKPNIMVGIDGYYKIATRSGRYAGQDAPEWCGEDGVWKDVWLSKSPPAAARVTIHTTDGGSITSTVLYDEAVQTTKDKDTGKTRPNFFWNKMPARMLAKCCESQCLRRLNPDMLSGTYTLEEMPAREDWDKPRREAVTTRARPTRRLTSGKNGSTTTRRQTTTRQPTRQQTDPNKKKPTKAMLEKLEKLAAERGVSLDGYKPETVEKWKLDMERLSAVETPAEAPVAAPDDDNGDVF